MIYYYFRLKKKNDGLSDKGNTVVVLSEAKPNASAEPRKVKLANDVEVTVAGTSYFDKTVSESNFAFAVLEGDVRETITKSFEIGDVFIDGEKDSKGRVL
jgi:hypothetical protein